MAKTLNNVLKGILKKPLNEKKAQAPTAQGPDIRQLADWGGQYHDRMHPPSGNVMPQSGEAEEPQDKVIVAIQHHFINGDFDKASALINTFRSAKGGKFFSYHHMNQLMDWVRNIYKYTTMKEFSRNYYNHAMSKDMEIQGIDDLTKVRVRDDVVEKFVEDTKKALNKKLKMK